MYNLHWILHTVDKGICTVRDTIKFITKTVNDKVKRKITLLPFWPIG